jgi:hypothetical protein
MDAGTQNQGVKNPELQNIRSDGSHKIFRSVIWGFSEYFLFLCFAARFWMYLWKSRRHFGERQRLNNRVCTEHKNTLQRLISKASVVTPPRITVLLSDLIAFVSASWRSELWTSNSLSEIGGGLISFPLRAGRASVFHVTSPNQFPVQNFTDERNLYIKQKYTFFVRDCVITL